MAEINPVIVPYISITPSSIHFGTDVTGSNYIIDVTTNGTVTVLNSSGSWYNIWTNSENVNKRYFFNCYDNNGGPPRRAVIEFKATVGMLTSSTYFILTQDGLDEVIGEEAKDELYVVNGPTVIPSQGGDFQVEVSVGGNAYKGGAAVTSWSNFKSNVSWITEIGLDESSYENGYYYTLALKANRSYNTNERFGICSFNYTLADGVERSASFYVYQEGANGISYDGNNPLIFNSSRDGVTFSPNFWFDGVLSDKDINRPSITSDFFTVVATAGGTDGGGYRIEYDIDAKYHNVYKEDRRGSVKFSYVNPSTSVENTYFLYVTQKGCEYPFGITYENGNEIGTVSSTNHIKIIRGIPFTATSTKVKCNFPHRTNGALTVALDSNEFATLETSTTGQDDGTLVNVYTIRFQENTSVYSRVVDLDVSYTTSDGEEHTDKVRLMQNASDGSNVNPSIQLNSNKMYVKWDGTPELYDYIRVRYVGPIKPNSIITEDWITVGEGTVVEGEGTYNVLYEYPVTFERNYSSEPRNGEITVWAMGITGSTTYSVEIDVIQAKSPDMEDIDQPDIPVEGGEYCGPIWKDVEYSFGGVEQVDYSIYHTVLVRFPQGARYVDKLIYKGRSCLRPSTVNNTILVNKICQSYMDSPMFVANSVKSESGYGIFKLKSADGETTYRTYRFVNDWSYSDDFRTGVLSHPILNERTVIRGQKLPFTVFGAADTVEIQYGIKYKDSATDDYGRPMEDWTNTTIVTNGLTTEYFPFDDLQNGVDSYFIGNNEYKVIEDCGVEFVLYYVNPWGGMDWFPIRGKVTENDQITQYTYVQNYNNQGWDFGKRRYLSEINKRYVLNTQWLKEEESAKMWYLLQSNTVYLHRLRDNKLFPVIITATSQEHKKRGIKSSRISYQIEVELSQTRERL
jgi:hypothetical protein